LSIFPFTECDVYGVNGQYLYDFFKAIKTSKDKTINYYSLEDNLIIDATYKNDEIELNVKLRKGPWDDDWQVEELITLDKNNYNNLLVQLATFLRLKNAIYQAHATEHKKCHNFCCRKKYAPFCVR